MKKNDPRDALRERVGGLKDLLGAGPAARHPLDDFGFQVSDELYFIDPTRVVLEGRYVRSFIEDGDFDAFCEAVKAEGEIRQPIGIRTAGPATDRRYILVYGMRRWKAALRAGLAKIPVRDFGEISEAESVALQMVENEARTDPHPVDTALGFHLMVEQGNRQADAARITGRHRSYVSMMRAVGEGIDLLDDAQRARLYAAPNVTVRAFQEIAQLPDARQRAEELLRLAGPQPADTEQAVERRNDRRHQAFHARTTRSGRTFRVQWREDDLREDPAGFARDFLRHLVEEQQHLASRLRQLREIQQKGGARARAKPVDPDALQAAIQELEEAIDRLGPEASDPQ